MLFNILTPDGEDVMHICGLSKGLQGHGFVCEYSTMCNFFVDIIT